MAGAPPPSSSSQAYLLEPIQPMQEIFRVEQIRIPPELPLIMKHWTKEVVRYQPKDIVNFSFEYFEAIADGDLEEFLKNGASIAAKKQAPTAQEDHGSLKQLSAIHHTEGDGSRGLSVSTTQIDNEARKREVFQKAFEQVDTDRSGEIDTKELGKLLQHLAWDSSDKAVAAATAALDKDNNGTIDLEEFLKWTEYAWKSHALQPTPHPQKRSGGASNFTVHTLEAIPNEADETIEEEPEGDY